MSVRRSFIVLLLLTIILPFVTFNRLNNTQTTTNAVDLANLQLYQVVRDDVALTVSAIGAIEPDNQVSLSFLTSGRVQEVTIKRDEYVLAGDVLVRLDNELQNIDYQTALRNVDLAELQLDDTLEVDETQVRLAELAVESARGAFVSASNAVSQPDLNAANLQYSQALERAETLRIERDRIGGQFGGESNQYDQANARYGEATFQAEIARLQAERLRTASAPQANAAWVRVQEAEAQLDQVKAGATATEIDTAQAQIEQSESQVTRAETAYNRTILTAPFDGVVTAINTEIGGLVAPGLSVIELTDTSRLSLTVQVDEIDITLVDEGMPARVTLDALPDIAFPATVASIAPFGTPSGGIVSYDVEIALDGNDPRVRVGMTAEATIVIEETQNVLTVPNLYIRRDRVSEQSFVNVLRDDDTIAEVEVTTGIQGRESSEILSGLQEGQLVAIDLGGGVVDFFGGNP